MKILNLMKILLLCVMTAGLASCGDDNYYTIQNSDEKLCSDSWVEEYDTEEGACRHILEFTKGKQVWGIERSVFFNGWEKWAKGFENQRV